MIEEDVDMSDFDYDDEYELSDSSIDDNEFSNDRKPKYTSPLEFKAYTTADLLKQMSAQSSELKDLLQLNTTQTITLLHYYKWNSERLIDEYTLNPSKILEKVGILIDSNSDVNFKKYDHEGFDCMICCETQTESYQLRCGHEFCINCYRRYVNEKLSEGKIIKCPGCDLSLNSEDIDNISGKGKSEEVLESSIKEFVERKSNYRWCPSPDCDTIIEILNVTEIPNIVKRYEIPVATCSHGHQFCVNCSFENHSPAPCLLTDAWIAKGRDDSETVNWILTNTQQCPKCLSSIEKNGGCNHMTCKKCSYEFCWICMGDWKAHARSFYQCNRFDRDEKEKITKKSKDALKKESAKRSLQRYMHFYNLFNVHEVSTKQDTMRCLTVEETVRSVQEASGISWIEAQFIAESAATLLAARRVLKWTYAIGYYCDTTSYFTIFENVQADLSAAVEGLSKLFEIEDPAELVGSKLDFLNKQGFLVDRQNAMVDCVSELLGNRTLDMQTVKAITDNKK